MLHSFVFMAKEVSKKTNERPKEVLLLAKRIKERRVELGYTNYENFAFEKEISRTQYGRYEKGEDLRFSSLLKVIKALGLTPQEFFSEGFEELEW